MKKKSRKLMKKYRNKLRERKIARQGVYKCECGHRFYRNAVIYVDPYAEDMEKNVAVLKVRKKLKEVECPKCYGRVKAKRIMEVY